MSSLKGGSFSKQIKNALIRINQIGRSKRLAQLENQSHSIKTQEFRSKLLNDFKSYLESENITNGKLNEYMSKTQLEGFIKQKTENLSYNSSKTIISGVSGLINALKETNVSIEVSKSFFKEIKEQTKKEKYTPSSSKDIHKSFKNIDNVISKLFEKSFEYGVFGKSLLETGLRHNENVKLLSNPHLYIQGSNIFNLKGKGGFVYTNKVISNELKEMIFSINRDLIPSHKQFYSAINSIESGKSSHSFRFQFSSSLYTDLTQIKKLSHIESLKIISNQLNHNRLDISKYYLNRI